MSDEKKFEKTFIRKKESKEGDNKGKKEWKIEVERIVFALASPSQQLKTLKIRINGDKSKTSAQKGAEEPKKKKKKRKKEGDAPKPKQELENQEKDETQKQKRMNENGGEEIEGLKETKKQKPTLKIAKIQGMEKNGEEEKVKEESSDCRFPFNRIVRIIKGEGSDYRLSQEAVFLINKATEKFIELFSTYAYDCAVQEKKSFVGYRHLSSAVGKEKRLDFLSDFVPEKVTAEKAMAGRKPEETLPG